MLFQHQFSNFHITLGDYFVRPSSPVLLRVGYMVITGEKKSPELYDNFLKVTLETGQIFQFEAGLCRFYNFGGIPFSNKEKRYFNLREKNGKLGTDNLFNKFLQFKNMSLKEYENNLRGRTKSFMSYSRHYCFHDLRIPKVSKFKYVLLNKEGEKLSKEFLFESNIATSPEPKISVMGDHDVDDTGLKMVDLLSKSNSDLLVFLGDLAYEITDFDGLKGDYYFETMEPLITKTPFIMTPGNHEINDDFHMIAARFLVPGGLLLDSISMFSFGINDWMFTLYNFSPAIYEQSIGYQSALRQLDEHLAAKSKILKPKWKYFVSHLPFYCSIHDEKGKSECFENSIFMKPFEDVLTSHSVNFRIGAHVHGYERLGSIRNFIPTYEKNEAVFVIGNGCASSHHLQENLHSVAYKFTKKILFNIAGYSTFKKEKNSVIYHHIDEDGQIVDYTTYNDYSLIEKLRRFTRIYFWPSIFLTSGLTIIFLIYIFHKIKRLISSKKGSQKFNHKAMNKSIIHL